MKKLSVEEAIRAGEKIFLEWLFSLKLWDEYEEIALSKLERYLRRRYKWLSYRQD